MSGIRSAERRTSYRCPFEFDLSGSLRPVSLRLLILTAAFVMLLFGLNRGPLAN
jgi:hypothetical protein